MQDFSTEGHLIFYDKDIVICRILKNSLLIFAMFIASPAEAMQVITHKTVDITSVNVTQLRRIYSMRQLIWENNMPIVVFVLPSKHPVHQKFSKEMLNIFPYKLDRIWNKLTFSGLGVAPKMVKTQAELLQAVSSTPGAIGYVEKVDKDEHVNVIEISM